MTATQPYLSQIEAPTRADVDALPGLTLLEFGTSWCGHCRAAQPALAEALAPHPLLRHIKVEDGPGHGLGRSLRVKLWPHPGAAAQRAGNSPCGAPHPSRRPVSRVEQRRALTVTQAGH